MWNKIKEKFKKVWRWFLGLLGVGAIAVALTVPNGAVLENQNIDGKIISFSYTDENSNENLIIHSDSGTYKDNLVYFSIENTTNEDQNISVVFTLKNNKAKVSEVEEFVSNTEVNVSSSSLDKKTVSNWSKKSVTKPDLKPIKDLIKNEVSVTKKVTVGNDFPVFESFIKAGETKIYKARVDVPYGDPEDLVAPEPNKISVVSYAQEFFIEVFGDQGGYGHLDPIAFVSSTGQEFTAATSYTVSSVTVTGSNPYAVVGIGLRTNAGDITGVTFNGVAMTELGTVNRAASTMTNWLFGLAGATSGDVVISGDTSLAAEVIVSIYSGVAQTGSTGTVATADGSGQTPSVVVSSAVDEMVVDMSGWNAGGQSTAGADQTERKESPASGDGISMNIASSDEAGAASTTMSWSIANAGGAWITIGVPLKPFVATGAVKRQDIIFFD